MGFDYGALSNKRLGIPGGWCVVAVGDVSSINELSIESGYPHGTIDYIDIASVEKGGIHSIQILALRDAPSRAKRIVRDKDILISTVRPNLEHYAFVRRAKPNTIASTGFTTVTAENVDPRYLYYYLTTKPFTAYLSQIAASHTSAYPAINPDVIETAELLLPPSDEQRAIARILGTLDDKIELNRRMNQTLEAMAQALFKSWFVDFDPFRDQSMQDSPLGEIPVGWETGTIGQISEIKMGQSPPGDTYNETGEGIPFYQGTKDFGLRFPRCRVYCTMPTRFAGPNDVLLSVRAPVGGLNVANRRCAIGRGLAALRSAKGHQSYLYYLLHNTKSGWETFNSEGTIFGCITKTDIADFKIVIPPVATVERFQSAAGAIDDLIENNEQESRTLATIRDTLLPRLLSGEIRVRDAERSLEEKT